MGVVVGLTEGNWQDPLVGLVLRDRWLTGQPRRTPLVSRFTRTVHDPVSCRYLSRTPPPLRPRDISDKEPLVHSLGRRRG